MSATPPAAAGPKHQKFKGLSNLADGDIFCQSAAGLFIMVFHDDVCYLNDVFHDDVCY